MLVEYDISKFIFYNWTLIQIYSSLFPGVHYITIHRWFEGRHSAPGLSLFRGQNMLQTSWITTLLFTSCIIIIQRYWYMLPRVYIMQSVMRWCQNLQPTISILNHKGTPAPNNVLTVNTIWWLGCISLRFRRFSITGDFGWRFWFYW